MKKLLHITKVFMVNVMVFIMVLGGIEAYYRISLPSSSPDSTNGLWQNFWPYVMFLTARGEYHSWFNRNTNTTYSANVVTNSLGFNERREFDYTTPYQKAPNERVVLFVSGSAGWGVGATSNEATAAGRLQFHLNSQQQNIKYTVVNLSIGSWLAIQQFIALELWGESFQPDWIVSMDGHNDASVGCQYSQGVGNPLYYATIKSYVDGYLFSTGRPVFFRGWFENQLIRYSTAYRTLSGKEYVRQAQQFDTTSQEDFSIRRQVIPTRMGSARQMLAFYLKAQRSMLRLYPEARYILSTQPMLNRFTGDFVDVYEHPLDSEAHRMAAAARSKVLEEYLSHFQEDWCTQKDGGPSFVYLFVNGALRLEQVVNEERARGRKVEYYNTGLLFPDAREERIPYFIDGVHLSDQGNDVLGKFYAERILAADSEQRSTSSAPH